MKITLQSTQFVFNPGSNQVDFSPMVGAFKPECLLAVIDTTTGKLVYAAASSVAGYGGTFLTNIYTNDTLVYASSNAGQSPSDILEILYDDQAYSQPITASDGTQVLTTTDAMSLKEGLDVNLLNSSFGGQLGNPIPLPNNNNALSMAFLNGSVLAAPRMDPVTNELIVQSSPAPLQDVNLTDVDGVAISLGQKTMSASLPVVLPSDQTIEVSVGQTVSQDILGVAVGGNRNNQIEVSFNTAPSASLITDSFSGSGSAVQSNGHTIYSTGTTAISSASGTTVQTTTYRPAHEIYAAFTAAFLNPTAFTEHRIGLFDNSDGFFIGYDGVLFGVTVRSAAVDTFTDQTLFNVDTLTGAAGSKFTRNGTPEAINFAVSNLFRIRFAWLGSANIFFEVFSPDAEWVLFHNIRQPNTSYNPSIQNPNLPMRVQVTKTSGATNASIATACWGAGTTSAYSPITATLTDNTLASLTRSVITGVTTGGGGGYVNVKVNPSGALVTDATGSEVITDSPDLYITGFGPQTTAGNNVLETTATANSTDTSGYRSGTVQIVSNSSSGTYIFEQSADNINFRPLAVFNAETANPNAVISAVTATISTIVFHFPIKARYIRCRIATTLNNSGIRAFTRLSQETWAPTAVQAINATAANLNVNATGTLTGVTTVTTVTTVATVTQSNTAVPVQITDVNNVAITATATAGPFQPTNGVATSILIRVATVSGTNPTMDVSVEMSDDGGTSWFKVYDFPRITAAGTYRSAPLKLLGNRVRYVQTIGGTTPSFLRTITRLQRSDTIFSRFVSRDRTIDPNTLSSTSVALYCEGTSGFNFYMRISAQTTPATIQIQFSDDNTNWYDDPGTTITTAVGIAQVKADNDQWRFARAIVSAAGTGITMDEFVIKALRE